MLTHRGNKNLLFNNSFLFGPNCLPTSFHIRLSVVARYGGAKVGHFGDNDKHANCVTFSSSVFSCSSSISSVLLGRPLWRPIIQQLLARLFFLSHRRH